MGGYTHLRVQVRPARNGPDIELCKDTGTGYNLVTHGWLKPFTHKILKVDEWDQDSIRGVGGNPIRLTEKASWTHFERGTRADGSIAVIQMSAEAWLLDDEQLPAGCLGGKWLRDRHAQIDYSTENIFYPATKSTVPFKVTKATSKAVTRKVTLQQTIVVAPGDTAHVSIKYYELLKGRSYIFTATHGAAMNGVIDATSAQVVVVDSPTTLPLQIAKGTRMGTIHECENTVNFVCSFKGALAALTAATAVAIIPSVFDLEGRPVSETLLTTTSDVHHVATPAQASSLQKVALGAPKRRAYVA